VIAEFHAKLSNEAVVVGKPFSVVADSTWAPFRKAISALSELMVRVALMQEVQERVNVSVNSSHVSVAKSRPLVAGLSAT